MAASANPASAQPHRDVDVVVYGATGFTGRLTIEYLAAAAPPSLVLAIGGRDVNKLEEIREHLYAKGRDVRVIAARSDDEASLRSMAARARVVISTVGPYIQHGEPLVAACIAEAADYLDITGEPVFVDRILSLYGQRAEDAGVRVVSCCGFDSVPHDLGVYYSMRQLQPKGRVSVEGFVQAGGGISGGTWHSAIGIMARMREDRGRSRISLAATNGRAVRGIKGRPHHEPEVGGWVLPFPSIDPAIVLRSARALDVYGTDFSYGHYIRVGSLPKAIGLGATVGAIAALSQAKPTRDILLRLKKQGEGPSEEVRKRGYFRVTFVSKTESERMLSRVSGGEPGYTETSKMLSECALGLLLDRDRLPRKAGVITPAVAFGDVLVDRLQAAGIRFEVVRRTKEVGS